VWPKPVEIHSNTNHDRTLYLVATRLQVDDAASVDHRDHPALE
jgi:hypothetical protein